MDQLQEIRRQRQLEYREKVEIPNFIKKCEEDKKIRSIITIQRAIRKNLFFDVINIINHIPHLFRWRVKLNKLNNLNKLNHHDNYNNYNNNSDELEHILKKSLKVYNEEYDDKINKLLYDSLDDFEKEEQNLEIAILESLKSSNNNNKDIGYCLDLRIFGPDPHRPIFINNKEYYLNKEQIDEINKIWFKINPSTSQGIRFAQDLEYYKAL